MSREAWSAWLVVLVAGIAGRITHTGVLFVRALAVGGVRLWREQSQAGR